MTAARVPIPPPPSRPLPLQPGDHLTRDEFERRYDATPNLKKAELLEGVVYMPPPPVSQEYHSGPHFNLIGWLSMYSVATPGVRGGDNGSLRLDLDNEPQPDAYLYILPANGGKVRISTDGYVEGAPELIAEVAASSVSYDLHVKKRVYQRNGVREYVVWRVFDRSLDWMTLSGGKYVPLVPGDDCILRSLVLPGLWLDADALIGGDMPTVAQVQQLGVASPEHGRFLQQLNVAGSKRSTP